MQIEDNSISVVIPCFNAGVPLLRAVDSMLCQTKQPSCVIVVNDGSTDEVTLSILNDLRKKQSVVVVDHEHNKGLPSARNTGARLSNAQFILFLDADDWYDSSALEEMGNHIPNNHSKFFIFCDISLAGDRSGTLRREYFKFSHLIVNGLPCSILVPRDSFISQGPYTDNMTLGMEDWKLSLNLISKQYTPIRIPVALFHYTVSSSGMYLTKTINFYFFIWRSIRQSLPEIYSREYVTHSFLQQVREHGVRSVLPALTVLGLSLIPSDYLATKLLLLLRRLTNFRKSLSAQTPGYSPRFDSRDVQDDPHLG
jgi:glycosyltransferase involved in cell wall biosynthesis